MDRTVDASQRVTVALVNDHELVVLGLQQMLGGFEDRARVVELCTDAEVEQPVDVVLYDTFAAGAGDEKLDHLLHAPQVTCVAVYTWDMREDLVTQMLGRGVRGYLSKSLGGGDLVAAIERLAAGEEVVLPTEDIGRDDARVVSGGWPGKSEGLSARQAEVVSLIAQGLNNAEIGERLYLTHNTVKSYIREAYRNMGVTTRTQAVLWGIEHGLTPSRPGR